MSTSESLLLAMMNHSHRLILCVGPLVEEEEEEEGKGVTVTE